LSLTDVSPLVAGWNLTRKHNDPQLDGCGSLENFAATSRLFAARTRYPQVDTQHMHMAMVLMRVRM